MARKKSVEPVAKEAPKKRRRGRGLRVLWDGFKLTFHVVVTLLLLFVLLGFTYALGRLKKASSELPTLEKLGNPSPGGVTEIYATNKDPATGYYVKLASIYDRHQTPVRFGDVPDVVKQATIAIEDERFYTHPGVDAKGVLRALYANFRARDISGQGASTLTMQLARRVILNDFNKVADRKFKEAFLALQIEKAYSKDQILERYLNEICYGNNIYGIKEAARIYMGKDLRHLTIGESAFLAGIPQMPSKLDPYDHFDAAMKRRKLVLNKMLELNYITRTQYDAALKEKPKIRPKPDRIRLYNFKHPYFTEYVYRQLKKKLGEEKVHRGGLKVFTTVNTQIQAAAEETIRRRVSWLRGAGVRQGAIVAMDPHTGFVRALVGGVDFRSDNYNNAVPNFQMLYVRDKNGKPKKNPDGTPKRIPGLSGMQPGSSFKPIEYAAAFDLDLLSPSSTILDGYGGAAVFSGWKPKNYGGNRGHGPVGVRQALAKSYNIAAVRVAGMVGIDRLVEYAHRLGIDRRRFNKGDQTRNYALALGAGEVSPLELATVYATFANGGNRPDPIVIRAIYDNQGNVLERTDKRIAGAVLSESAAIKISSCLRSVVEIGTAARSGLSSIPDAHGKTGTTSDNLDAWFAGYTSSLACVVWISGEQLEVKRDRVTKKPLLNKDGSPVMWKRKRTMVGVTGGENVAPIWGDFIRQAVPIQQQAPGVGEYKVPEIAEALRRAQELKAMAATPRPPSTALGQEAPPSGAASRERWSSEGMGDDNSPDARERPARPLRAAQDRDSLREGGDSDERIEVAICAETSKLASAYCPETIQKRFTRRNVPRTCRLHRAPEGEE